MWCYPKSSRQKHWTECDPKAATYLGYLRTHDMKIVLESAVEAGIIPKRQIQNVVAEYRRFLALHLEHPKANIPAGGMVDKLWHHHLAFTENYAEMCSKVGRMIHHRPAILDRHKSTRSVSQDSVDILYKAAFNRMRPIGLWT